MRQAATPAAVEGGTVADCRRAWAAEFRACGIDSPELDARVLIGHALGLDHAALAARAEQPLSAEQQSAIAALARRRLAHEPVARITGTKEFWSLPLRVNGATLVPRPETETVVTAALRALDRRGPRSTAWRIADIGTGTGAILLALLHELPDAFGVGTDISLAALRTAKANAARLGFAERAVFIACNYTAALSGPFDLMVSNPPYIRSADIPGLESEVRNFDPLAALNGGADGLDAYRAIIPAAAGLLGPAGALIVEAGLGQSGQIQGLMTASGLTLERNPKADLAGVPRAVAGRKAPR